MSNPGQSWNNILSYIKMSLGAPLNLIEISDSDINAEFKNLISTVNKKLPNYKHIKDFKVVEKEFEKTTTQKIKRFGDNLSM